jgi:hypothetical protein
MLCFEAGLLVAASLLAAFAYFNSFRPPTRYRPASSCSTLLPAFAIET